LLLLAGGRWSGSRRLRIDVNDLLGWLYSLCVELDGLFGIGGSGIDVSVYSASYCCMA
jgi:hypothetical protein